MLRRWSSRRRERASHDGARGGGPRGRLASILVDVVARVKSRFGSVCSLFPGDFRDKLFVNYGTRVCTRGAQQGLRILGFLFCVSGARDGEVRMVSVRRDVREERRGHLRRAADQGCRVVKACLGSPSRCGKRGGCTRGGLR